MTESTQKVFISYRREESRGFAGRIYDRLAQRLDPTHVFMDVDSIEPGQDFTRSIANAVGLCDVLLAIIGPSWVSMAGARGRRIDDPDDFVAIEIGAALSRNIRVIPVLVDGATMPRRDELPTNLAELAHRNALRLDHDSFARDVESLMALLERTVPKVREVSPGGARKDESGQSLHVTARPSDDGPTGPDWLSTVKLAPWNGVSTRVRRNVNDTLYVRLRLSIDEHLICVKWAWRDCLEVDGRTVKASLNNIVGVHDFELIDASSVLPAEIEIKASYIRFRYNISRLRVGGRAISLTEIMPSRT